MRITPDATPTRRPDALGWRAKLGVLVPSTNTTVEPDFYSMTVAGVTAHTSRIHIRDIDMSNDEVMHKFLEQVRAELSSSIERVLTCVPDRLVMGMSAETFWGGKRGADHFQKLIEDQSGLEVSTGALACEAALETYGARRIGVITPYQEVGDINVKAFFTELGYDVVAIKGLKCPDAVSIAHVTEDTLRNALLEVDSPDVDVLVQAGTNLSMVRLADEAERWLGKPVIAINAATWWHALRAEGITERVYGAGGLLRDW